MQASDLPLHTIKYCSVVFSVMLRLLVINIRRLPPSTNSAAYQRLVSSTSHGPLQLSVLHLAAEAFTTCNGARHWLTIAIFCLSHLPSTLRLGGPCQNIALMFGTEKLEWCGYVTVKKFEDMFLYFYRVHERDGQTDTTWRHRPHLYSIAWQKLCTKMLVQNIFDRRWQVKDVDQETSARSSTVLISAVV